ncbi:MAG: alpha/beta hydrolase [Ornithinimicrobium sp.]
MDVVLVGGLWLTASAWDEVVPALEDRGHRAVAVSLPGQGDGNAGATLQDQVNAVLAMVDTLDRPWVVGHSAACSLAWVVADARPDGIAGVTLVGGFPAADGELYADFFEIVDGAMPFPGWDAFEGPDSADLGGETRARMSNSAAPVPEGVARAVVRLRDERRHDVPVLVVCPEFSPKQARKWIEGGDVPELQRARQVNFADLDSGHWPMFTRPDALAGCIVPDEEP